MNKLLLFSTALLFSGLTSFGSPESLGEFSAEEHFLDSNCTVRYDCDGDGRTDYEGTVNCDYAADLVQQYQDSCD